MLEYKLQFADLILKIISEKELKVDDSLTPFLINNDEDSHISVFVSWNWDTINISEDEFLGEDAILRFYESGEKRYCVTKGGYKGEIGCVIYGKDLRIFNCVINSISFPYTPDDIAFILRMLPIREIFTHYGVLFFHASQILYNGKGIIFTAPSGTGKTTQAKLWEKFRYAEIVCNDRTLVKKSGGKWLTYGYPIDGSQPVRSSAVNELGCIVLLEQSEENYVEKLEGARAITNLMPQIVLDVWNKEEQTKVLELILSLLENKPVYLLHCTPETDAVEILEKELIEARII